MGLRENLLKNFVFPKVFLTNSSGIIISEISNKFCFKGLQARTIFFFEDLFVDLYVNSVKKIGEERTKDLWYKIGKDMGTRAFLFLNHKFFIQENDKLFFVLQEIFNVFFVKGFSFTEKIIFSSNKLNFIVNIKSPAVARKINDGAFLAGIFSGVFSYIYKKNIEAKFFLVEENIFKIIISKDFSEVYFPNIFDLAPDKNYKHLNFPKNISNYPGRKICSLSDLIKFNKVSFDENSNNWMFMDKVIFPCEIGLFTLIFCNYTKENLFELIRDSYIFSAKKIFNNFLKNEIFLENRVHFLISLFSGFGWGNLYLYKRNKEVTLKFKYAPFSKYGFLDKAFFLNGAINSVFGKDFILSKASNSEFIYTELGVNHSI